MRFEKFKGVLGLKDYIEERTLEISKYIVEHKATVREAAKVFGVSKAQFTKDVTERLPDINFELYKEVREILSKNKAERHIRGGKATKIKYQKRTINFKKIKEDFVNL